MKKVLCVILAVLVFAGVAGSLEMRVIRLGLLSKLNTSEEEFTPLWRRTFAPKNEALDVVVKFYESLTAMLMALNAGEIHQMVLPEASAQYVMTANPELEASLVLTSRGMGLSFGFRAGDEELRKKFNEAIDYLRSNWTLGALEGMYIASNGHVTPEPVEFAKIDRAATIRVAVTGDLPPIDYIAPDGTPAGFNTAVLAEIGRHLGVNVELVEVDAGARTAALASGRADVVFWYEVDTESETQPDIPEGVIVSQPYYEWTKFIHVRKALRRDAPAKWDIKNSILDLFGFGR